MKPFFFGNSARPLFGIHHTPDGPRRGWGVLVCGPFGQEALRAHRSLRDLSSRLAAAGFDVLRFDYTGCGDSGGSSEAGSLGQWQEDVATAAEELRELAGAPRLALVGLRLGGTLAARHGSRGQADALVLWDPVLDGGEYLVELEASHRAWMTDHAHRPDDPTGRLDQVLGFPLSEALAQELAALELSPHGLDSSVRTLVVSSADEPRRKADALGVVGARLETAAFPQAPVWLHAEGMDRALVPAPLLDHVTGWLEAACP